MTTVDTELLPEPLPPAHRGWRTGDLVRAAFIVFAVWFAFRLVWSISSLVFLVFLATLFGLAVATGVDYFERFGVRRGIASAILVLGTIGAIGTGLGFAAPTLVRQGLALQNELPEALEKASRWLDSKRDGLLGKIIKNAAAPAPVAGQPPVVAPPVVAPPARSTPAAREAQARSDSVASAPSTAVKQRITSVLANASGFLFNFLSNTLAVAAALVMLIFLVMYIGAEPEIYRGWILAAVPAVHRPQARLLLAEMSKVLRKWLVTQLVAMVVIGVVSSVSLMIVGVKSPIALGFIAGLMEFIPTIGPVLAAVPAVIMGFTDSPGQALTVAILHWAIQFLENNLLIPALMRGEMDLPPAITLVAQALMTLVFGFIGLMVAVPLTAAVLVPMRIASERENARERAMVKFAKLHGQELDPTPHVSLANAERTIVRADRGPDEAADAGSGEKASTENPETTTGDSSR
jgi:predicted PurR-regulated permease PerM